MSPRGEIISGSPSETALQEKAVTLPIGEKTVSWRTRNSKLGTKQGTVFVLEFILCNSYRTDFSASPPFCLGHLGLFVVNIYTSLYIRSEEKI
jgi:hypothetical protein